MEPALYRILKSITVIVFVLSCIFFLSSQLVSVASRTYPVENEENEIIGSVIILHDYTESQFTSLTFMVFSGIQLWTLMHLGKRIREVEEELEFNRQVKSEQVEVSNS